MLAQVPLQIIYNKAAVRDCTAPLHIYPNDRFVDYISC